MVFLAGEKKEAEYPLATFCLRRSEALLDAETHSSFWSRILPVRWKQDAFAELVATVAFS